MSKRGKNDHLSDAELQALRKELRAGVRVSILAKRFNLSERVVYIRRAEIFGKVRSYSIGFTGVLKRAAPKKLSIPAPNAIPSISLAKLMGGK